MKKRVNVSHKFNTFDMFFVFSLLIIFICLLFYAGVFSDFNLGMTGYATSNTLSSCKSDCANQICEKFTLFSKKLCIAQNQKYCKNICKPGRCTDSDGGDFPLVKGKVVDIVGDGYTDSCLDSKGNAVKVSEKLRENLCATDGYSNYKYYDCRCANGACLK